MPESGVLRLRLHKGQKLVKKKKKKKKAKIK